MQSYIQRCEKKKRQLFHHFANLIYICTFAENKQIMRCPKCNSNNKTKAGFIGKKTEI